VMQEAHIVLQEGYRVVQESHRALQGGDLVVQESYSPPSSVVERALRRKPLLAETTDKSKGTSHCPYVYLMLTSAGAQ
jgi:hypothetical protein